MRWTGLYGASTAALVVLVGAAAWWFQGGRDAAGAAKAPSYASEKTRMDERIGTLKQHARAHAGDWMPLEALAQAYAERARFTGDYDDYAAAETTIGRAFALAPRGTGPFMTRARLHYTMHRIDRVEEDLQAIERQFAIDDPTRASIVAMRADVAFQRGDYAEARRGFEEAARLHPGFEADTRLAIYAAKTGDPAEAKRRLLVADAQYHGTLAYPHAWTRLQLGLLSLDAGQLDDALAHYREAATLLPGWWLVDEHIAEALMLQGHAEEAERRYRDLVRRTRDPEFMDPLAILLAARGASAESKRWVARAAAIHERRLARFPEAACGHALQHFLRFGDPTTTVRLAERNVALRPNGEAKTLLAKAYLRAGRVDDARATIEQVFASAWKSKDLDETATEVFEGAGALASGR